MSLLEIKRYLKEVKMASVPSLCAYFNCDASLIREMLNYFLLKGQIRANVFSANCGSCTKCPSKKSSEVYEWVENSNCLVV